MDVNQLTIKLSDKKQENQRPILCLPKALCYNGSRMKTTTYKPRRRLRVVPPRPAVLAALSLIAVPGPSAFAQDTAPPAAMPAVTPVAVQNAQQPPAGTQGTAPTPQTQPPAGGQSTTPQGTQLPGTPTAPRPPGTGPSPANTGGPRVPTPPAQPYLDVETLGASSYAGNVIHARNGVTVTYQGISISADSLDGNVNRELVFTGHARIERQGSLTYADSIRFSPRDGRFSMENPRGALDPSLLQNQITVPVFFSGGEVFGDSTGYSIADRIIATTCIEHYHHYELHIANAELIPDDRLILRRVSVIFFGVKVITLPIIVIPLKRDSPARRPRTDYLPEFGQNVQEGYFARFPYVFSEGSAAATFLRADITQLLGPGYRVEQEWLLGKQSSLYNTSGASYGGGLGTGDTGAFNTAFGYGTAGPRLPNLGTGTAPQNGGLFTMQGYFEDGFSRNFNAGFQEQQSIGGSNRFTFNTELQNNSFYVLGGDNTSSTAQTTRFDFAHSDQTHGVNGDLSINLSTSDNSGSTTDQLTGTWKQSFLFDSSGTTRNNLSFNIDFTHLLSSYSSGTGPSDVTRTEQLNPAFDLQHVARDWSWDLNANDSIPIGFQSGGSNFGTLEKLPELTMSTDTFNYRGGWLRNLQSTFQFGIGQYSEPVSDVMTDRVLLAWNVKPITILQGNTELVTTAGFEQHFYGDGAADYIMRDNAQFRQHLGGRSGIDITYDYEQPEGGTPFLFDQFHPVHNVSLQAGYLDDKNFQATARVGYDLLGGDSTTPWQSLSTNFMWRPSPYTRYDLSAIYDPNEGKFFSFVNTAKWRSKNDFAFDLVTNIDPNQPGTRRKFTAINTQFDIPIAHRWRLTGLLNFSGLTGQFETRNIQIAHDWDCLEATFTYTETIGTFQPDREFYLAIRIKGLPFSRAFARGPAGAGLGTGVANFY
jgi:hypothetical protein